MSLIKFINTKRNSFFVEIQKSYEIEIIKDKINLESFLGEKRKYIQLLNSKLNCNIKNITIKTLEQIEIILEDKRELINDEIMFALCYIVGEIIIQELGGNWDIGKFKKDLAYGFPIILNWGNDGIDHMRLSPIEWVYSYKNDNLRLGTISKMILQNKQWITPQLV